MTETEEERQKRAREQELQVEAESKPPKKKRTRGKTSKKIKTAQRHAKTIELKAKGLSLAEIAGATGQSTSTVKRVINQFKDIFPELEKIEEYQGVRNKLFDAAQFKVLKSMMAQDKHDKATLNGAAYAAKILNDMRRLEEGKSTHNVAVSFTKANLSKYKKD